MSPLLNPMKNHLLLIIAIISVAFSQLLHADHIAEIQISVTQGSIGSHFSIYHGHKDFTVDGHSINLPFTSNFTKIANRDDDSTPITPGNPWVTKVSFAGGGRFILDISDWRNHPFATVLLKIDGQVFFKGSGSANNYKGWTDKYFGQGVQQTDDREIAFDLQ